MTRPAAATPWWRDAVCYELYPRAFADADGDGVGDLPGAARRLDHLAWLGVDAVWITPFYPSPLADGGYDIADHTAVAPELGGDPGFTALVERAHALHLKVLIDLVPNHVSDRHPWFRAALAAGPGAPQRDRFLFRAGRGAGGHLPPNDWRSAFGGPAWTRVTEPDGTPGAWYLHLHAAEQPDLDWRDPEVARDFERTLRYWLDRGADGFRIDVAHALFKEPGLPDAGPGQHTDLSRNHLLPYYDRDELHPLFRSWRAVLDSHPAPPGAVAPADRLLVAEAAVFDAGRLARYVRPGEMNQTFTFDLLECGWHAGEIRAVAERSAAAMASVGAPVTWVLSSHDAIRPVTRYGGGPAGLRRARAAALLMLALPGAAYVYQGEELGLPQAELPDSALRDPLWERSGHRERGRDGARVPLPWQGDEPPYGFSTAAPSACWFPQPPDWGPLSVAAQRCDAASTLRLYRWALRLRRELLSGGGSLTFDGPPGGDLLSFPMGDGTARCLVNFGPDPVPLPDGAELLVASAALTADDRIPTDTAVWVTLPQR
ncbi:alpha-amylase family glycosyl hydrolase [Streptomyces sp. SL13]|uniref:Alpha-amylase family glycosyl hydrolase n=1 Tax=Streptantibioticus silvisoli TaxID=2705255 RepID=A0AA90H8A7_9ACTN|nr:alpha-amylase family glycosyl hydrolase [Streptantibioticus silvisoli]MDI5972758.1 alpha-amylase family glycosyl hydrolase [Streptantibioticus silvisoli]